MGMKRGKQPKKADTRNKPPDHGAEATPVPRRRKALMLSAAALAAVVGIFLLYGQTLQFPFLYDDLENILNNRFIRMTHLSPGALLDAGFKSVAGNRPVANISFALNYYVHGYDVRGFHAMNILIHLLTGLLLFLLMRDTLAITREKSRSLLVTSATDENAVALAIALVWLVHPLHTQSITYIVQRMTGMAAMFSLLSLLCYVRARVSAGARGKYALYGASVLSWLLAVGSKEISFTLPFFVLLYEWFFFQDLQGPWLRRRLPAISLVLAAGVILGLLYLRGHPWETILAGYQDRDFTMGQRVLTELRVVMMYLGLVFFPYPGRLNLDYDFPLSSSLVNPPTTLIALLAIIGLLGLAVFIAKKDRLVSFAILWFFGNLVIESSVIPLELVYEHRTYLPSMFMVALPVVAADRLVRERWVKIVLLCAVMALFSLWTYQRNQVWHDDITLWQDCVKKSPNKARTHNNYGLALLAGGRVDEAIAQCRQAVELAPNVPGLYNSLGKALVRKNMLDEAVVQFHNALSLRPDYDEAVMNMASALDMKGDMKGALHYYELVLRKDPHNEKALNGLGKALTSLKKYEDAMRVFSHILAVNPDSFVAYNSMGNLSMIQGDMRAARNHYQRAIRMNPAYAEAYLNLGALNVKQGRIDEGIGALQKAVALSPDNELAHSTLASAYLTIFDLDNAVRQYEVALRISPGNGEVRDLLDACIEKREVLDTSIGSMQKKVASDPESAELRFRLGELYMHRGDLDTAIREMRKSLSLERTPQALNDLVTIFSLKGDNAQALRCIEELLKLEPEDPMIHYNAACIYSRMGRVDEALHSLRIAVKRGFRRWDIMDSDPDLERLRETERYREIIRAR